MIQSPRQLAGNQSIALDSTAEAGILVAGSAEVFAIDRESGERLNLFSIAPGEPILPISYPAGEGWDLVAITLEPSVVESTHGGPHWSEIFALENWLEKIGAALVTLRNAADVQPVECGKLLLAAGQRIGVEAGLCFVTLDSGAGRLSGAPIAAGSTVALAPGLWLEAGEEAEWTALVDAPIEPLRQTLHLAIGIFLKALREHRNRREEEERSRFTLRQVINERALANALGALAGLRSERSSRGEAGDSALTGAVRAVLDELGVALRGQGRLPEIAHASGVRVRQVLLSGEWWRAENGPLVGYRGDGSPVALLQSRGGRYSVFDPQTGLRERVTARVAAELQSFAQMLYRPLPEDLSTGSLLRYLVQARAKDLRTMAVAGIGASLLAFAAPTGAAMLIGQAIPDANRNMVWQIALGMVAAALGAAGFLLAQAIATLRLQTAAFYGLQAGVWDYLLKLSPSFFRRHTVGELRKRADAVTRIFQMLSADALRSLMGGVASVLIVAMMFFYSAGLALIALACGAVVAGATWLGVRALYRVQGRWQEDDEALSGLVLQSLQAVSKLRVAGAEDRAFAVWALAYSGKRELSLRIRGIRDRIRVLNLAMPPLASALGFIYLLSTPIPLASFLACDAAMAVFLAAITSGGDTAAGLVLVANLWQRMRTILAATPEVNTRKTDPGRLRGEVALENITFRYRADGPLILDGVSMKAQPGECIAITGPSGGGKSTLLNLLLRFETPQTGAIYLDGHDLSNLDIIAVRRRIGVVTQDGRVMAGSIFENICAGGVHSMEDAWAAARDAGLGEDIENMPMGMHTVVSEGGGNLSGGQRQRLLIARALVLKPSILIFDEATSALDNRTQRIVTESLKRLRATRILVAHRLSTIRTADRIYVIEKGRVVQQGTYSQLASAPGLFAQLARRQTV